jgi:hypothetical protein
MLIMLGTPLKALPLIRRFRFFDYQPLHEGPNNVSYDHLLKLTRKRPTPSRDAKGLDAPNETCIGELMKTLPHYA